MFHRESLRSELAILKQTNAHWELSGQRWAWEGFWICSEKLPLPSEMAWYPYSPAVRVSNLGKVPRVVFAHQSISFLILKHCYQNIQEALHSSSTQLEMRMISRLGESIYPLENIKELWSPLGKYSYHVPNIESNGFTLTQLKEVPQMQAENNSSAFSADLYLIELLQGRLKLCTKWAAAWHIHCDQAHDSLDCLDNVLFVHMNKSFIGPPGKLSSGKWPCKSGDREGREISQHIWLEMTEPLTVQ